ncbi:MAG: zinc ribbon domain-containing protein [Candidatus Ratteibacteria bacterium]|jgi:putative FmdB family regulatory protein
MPTYEYECESCGYRFEKFQSMSDAPVKECPKCEMPVRKRVSAGSGMIVKGKDSCEFVQSGRRCCGASSPCDTSPFAGKPKA